LTKFGIIALSIAAVVGVLWFSRTSRAQEAPKGLEGTWQGALGAGSPQQLRVVVTITKSSEGSYAGVLESVDQGATLPLSTVTLNGSKVRFEITSIGGVYEGQLNEEQTKLTG